jgi:hypothetical protein
VDGYADNIAQDVALIKNTPGVKAIRPIRIFPKPRYILLSNSVIIYQLSRPAKRHMPLLVSIHPDTFSSHILGVCAPHYLSYTIFFPVIYRVWIKCTLKVTSDRV